MKIIRQNKDIKKLLEKKYKFSFIPTMGGLHKGHEFLIKEAKRRKNRTMVSIFVNPKQFNSKTDFKSYPRNLKKDIKILKRLKVDYLYIPSYRAIFSFKIKNKIYLDSFSSKLCGKFRPGHFKGVVNVVNRFLELISPKYLYLGNKDFQQLILLKKHIKKNKIPTTIVSCNTIRMRNLLPYSTRNNNLSKKSIKLASKVFNLIRKEKKLIKRKKVTRINFLKLRKKLSYIGIKKIDYIKAINLSTLKYAKKHNERFNIFSAFYLNDVRLIDNF